MLLELFVYEGRGTRRDWVTLAMPPPYGWIDELPEAFTLEEVVDGPERELGQSPSQVPDHQLGS